MSGAKRTEDLHSLKTRSFIYQNPDTTFPPVGSVLATYDTHGRQLHTFDLSINSITANTSNFAELVLTSGPTSTGVLLYHPDGIITINGVPFNTAGIQGTTGPQGIPGLRGLAGPPGPSGSGTQRDLQNPPEAPGDPILPWRQYQQTDPDNQDPFSYGYSGSSANVLLLWTNPPQLAYNSFSYLVPIIRQLSITLTPSGGFPYEYPNITDHLPGSDDVPRILYPITGILLSKGYGPNGYTQVDAVKVDITETFGVYQIFVGDSYGDYTTATFGIKVTYTGYNATDVSGGPNYLDISGLSFRDGSGPSAPQFLTVTTVTNSGAGVTYNPPIFTDSINSVKVIDPGAPTIKNYILTTKPISSIRYGGPYDTTSVSTTVPGTTSRIQDATLVNRYPDTYYSLSAVAQNSVGYTGPSSNVVNFTTLEDTSVRPSYVDTIAPIPWTSFAPNLYYNGAGVVGSVYNINSIDIGPIGVHVPGDRGSSASAIMTVVATAGSSQAALPVGGFGQPLTSITENGITITEVGVTSTGVSATSGFYLDASFQLVVPGTTEPQNLQLTQTFLSSLSVPDIQSPIYTYYWDTLAPGLSPSLSGLAVTVSPIFVCGIPLIGESFPLEVTALALGQMGAKLYVKNPITFEIYDTSGVLIQDFPDPVPTNITAIITVPLADVSGYILGTTLRVTATNINGLQASTSVSYPYVADPLSVIVADEIATLSYLTDGTVGQRITTPTNIDTDPATLVLFNNNAAFTNVGESLLSHGVFYMYGNSSVFINYTPYNGPVYFPLSPLSDSRITFGYQYTTFLWQGVAGNNSIAYLNLIISFTDPVTMEGPTENSVELTTTGNPGPIDVYYNVTCDDYVSAWINANSTVGRLDFNTNSKILGAVVGGYSSGFTEDTVAFYTLLLPTPYISDGSTVAVTVGLPYQSTTGIRSIVCAYG
jgi:hypothetical protein